MVVETRITFVSSFFLRVQVFLFLCHVPLFCSTCRTLGLLIVRNVNSKLY